MVSIVPIKALKDNYIWAVVDHQQRSALIIDPGEAAPVLDFLKAQKLNLNAILVTHHHWDHVNGIAELLMHDQVPVFGGALCKTPQISHHVSEHDIIFNYHVMTIPGHTLDHVAYYDNDSIFCGDTLFAGGCGRLFEGSAAHMHASLQKIAALPEHTRIFCAHEYTVANLRFAQTVEPNNQRIQQRLEAVLKLQEKGLPSLPSTLREEKQTNPFLRCDISDVIQHVQQHAQQTLDCEEDIFAALRQWKDDASV